MKIQQYESIFIFILFKDSGVNMRIHIKFKLILLVRLKLQNTLFRVLSFLSRADSFASLNL